MWVETVWSLLFAVATIRALTTAWRKQGEGKLPEDATEDERLTLREDAVHWWLATIINGLLLSIGIVALLTHEPPDTTATLQDQYVLAAFLAFAILINIRIEAHGHYYRKRNAVDIWGRPKEDPKERDE